MDVYNYKLFEQFTLFLPGFWLFFGVHFDVDKSADSSCDKSAVSNLEKSADSSLDRSADSSWDR